MKRFIWIAAAAVLASACSDESKLYTSAKYVPGYKPTGATAPLPAKGGVTAASGQELASR
jgi:hypothetical protein